MEVTIDKAADLITTYIKANVPCNLIGSPGLGKSDIIKSVAKALNLYLIDFRLSTADPTDLSGMPFIEDGRSVFLPNIAFPIETDTIPEGYSGWLLFLDEISNAPMSVQAAAYKLILDREVGMHKVHPNVRIVSAGNKLDDGAAVVAEMSTALKSRMAHINIKVSVQAWIDWALGENLHHSITSFIKFKPECLYQFNPKVEQDTFPCPRTWSMAADVIDAVGFTDSNIQTLLSGVIGDGAAVEYINFAKHFSKLPTFESVVKDPENTPVPSENSSAMFAMSGSIAAQTDVDTIGAVAKYMARMPKEFQLRTFVDITKRKPTLAVNPALRQWLVANASEMVRA